ncbi:MAG: hypothetical protein MMC33_005822 [Icmadophila ericetorum]|nr:hypothetical protein [Icmadophila ericetorum]
MVISPSTTSSAPTQTLTFPAPTFAKLAPHQYLLTHLSSSPPNNPPLRPSGRPPAQFRPASLHTSSLTHASGSAVVRLGDTAVVCGVRGEILLTRDIPGFRRDKHGRIPTGEGEEEREEEDKKQMKELGLVVPNIELATGCSPDFLPGGPPSALAQSLSQRVLTLLHTGEVLGMDGLRIWSSAGTHAASRTQQTQDSSSSDDDDDHDDEEQKPEVKAFWTLYIDILFISLDGNPFDSAWTAVLAALRDTALPRAWWDEDLQYILCSDDPANATPLRIKNWPIASTFAVFESGRSDRGALGGNGSTAPSWILADPDHFEESLCEEGVTVVLVRKEGRRDLKAVRIEKSGGGVVGVKEMREVVGLAEGRYWELRKLVEG